MRIKVTKTLIGIATALVAVAIAVPASGASSEVTTSPTQDGETTTSVPATSYVTTASTDATVAPSNTSTPTMEATVTPSVNPTPTISSGGAIGQPSTNRIPPSGPNGVRAVAEAAIVRRKKPGPWKTVTVSTYGKGRESQGMAFGGKTTQKVTITIDGKKKKAYVAIIAHKSLPRDTIVEVYMKGVTAWYVVKDRGPYIPGRVLDLGPRGQDDFHFSGVGKAKFRVIGKLRKGRTIRNFPGLVTKYTKFYRK